MYEGMTKRERRLMCKNLTLRLQQPQIATQKEPKDADTNLRPASFLDLQLLNLHVTVFSTIINPNTDSNGSSLLLIPDSYEPFHVVVSHTPTLSSLGATSATVTTELALFIGNMT